MANSTDCVVCHANQAIECEKCGAPLCSNLACLENHTCAGESRVCDYCGFYDLECRKYNNSDHIFCSRTCYETFYKELNHTIKCPNSTSLHSSTEVRAIHEEELNLVKDLTQSQVEERIQFLISKQQEYRMREQITRGKLAKLHADSESQLVEREKVIRPVKVRAEGKSKWTKAVESFQELMKLSIPDITFDQAEKMLLQSTGRK